MDRNHLRFFIGGLFPLLCSKQCFNTAWPTTQGKDSVQQARWSRSPILFTNIEIAVLIQSTEIFVSAHWLYTNILTSVSDLEDFFSNQRGAQGPASVDLTFRVKNHSLCYHLCEWHLEKAAPSCRYPVLKSLGLKQIGEKWFVFTFLEGNYFCSCSTLPFISFILTAFHSSGTRASVCVTWVIINQAGCSIHHSSEWQQCVSCLCMGCCGLQNSLCWKKTHRHWADSLSLLALFHPSSCISRWMSVEVTSLGTLEVQHVKLCQRHDVDWSSPVTRRTLFSGRNPFRKSALHVWEQKLFAIAVTSKIGGDEVVWKHLIIEGVKGFFQSLLSPVDRKTLLAHPMLNTSCSASTADLPLSFDNLFPRTWFEVQGVEWKVSLWVLWV